MKRLGAVVLAIAMIVGAVLLRNQIDGGSDNGGGGGGGDRDGEPFRLVCATELADVCAQLVGARDDIDLTVVDPGTTADVLADEDTRSAGFDAWLVDGPWPQIVADNREFAGLGEADLGDPSKVLARSPALIATQAAGRSALETTCGGTITWKCIGEQAPGNQRIGLPTPERGDGLAALASATNSYFAPESYSSVDFEDPGFSGWFDQLTDLSVTTSLGRQTPLARALAARGTFSTVGALESQTARLLDKNNQYVTIYPEPMVTADVVLAPRRGLDATDALDTLGVDEVSAALEAGRWRIDGTAPEGASDPPGLPKSSGMPSAGVLQRLRELW